MNSIQNKSISNIHIKKRVSLLIENKWKILAYLFLGGLAGAAISFILPKKYEADSVIYFKYDSYNNNLLDNTGSLDNEIDILKSNDLLADVQNSLSKKGMNINIADLKDSYELLYDNLSPTIGISAESNEAQKTSDIANAIANNFYNESVLKDRHPFMVFLKALDDRQKKLQSDIQSLGASQQTSFASLSPRDDQVVTQISEFESELEEIEIENHFYQDEMANYQRVLQDKFPQIYNSITSIDNSGFNDLRQKVEHSVVQEYLNPIDEKLQGFQISYPWGNAYTNKQTDNFNKTFNSQLSSIVNDIADKNNIESANFLKKLVSKYYESSVRVNAIDAAKNIIFNIMTSLEDKFNSISYNVIDFARDLRSRRFNNDLNLKLQTEIDKIKSTEKNYITEVESIQKAEVPETFSSPNIVLNIIFGLLLGLIAGLVISLFTKTQNLDLVTSAEEIEASGFKIIAQISHFDSIEPFLFDSSLPADNNKTDRKTIHSFENIHSYLKFGNLDKPLKTILVTSGSSGEGKSTIASNIAVVLANKNNRVLLVDADFVKPELNKFFRIKSTPSLAHYLFRKKELEEIIRSTYKKELDIITCIEFPQNPSAIITSERMKNFMEIVEKQYDFVIYDSASLDLLSETTFIGENVDEVILVVKANQTKFSEITNTQRLLDNSGISKFDIILNDV